MIFNLFDKNFIIFISHGMAPLVTYKVPTYPLTANFSPKNTIFNRLISFFLGCHDAELAYVLLKKSIFYQIKIDFSKIRHKIVQYFNSVHAHALIIGKAQK